MESNLARSFEDPKNSEESIPKEKPDLKLVWDRDRDGDKEKNWEKIGSIAVEEADFERAQRLLEIAHVDFAPGDNSSLAILNDPQKNKLDSGKFMEKVFSFLQKNKIAAKYDKAS